ncbi:helix-turn-helix domain-containing protein [Solidesulfovibrio alcoholivorans]|uniref:helix-turn-helix domain-containing protein n=1 Tax=Solidesulfovibrio alcoholivorans TaxID=81406 RepID=UPI0006945AEB|nr:helix-turn-helix transcriptional regulator [Solidesulfovibrio alcoholivorans]
MEKSLYSRRLEDLARLLRETREAAGLRQADVAEKLRKPQPFVSRYEAGQRRLDLVELEEVCRVLGVRLSEFVKKFEKI